MCYHKQVLNFLITYSYPFILDNASTVACTRLFGLFEPKDFAIISFNPASSRTGLAAPPAINPVPSEAGLNNILLALYLCSISCAIVVPLIETVTKLLNASSKAFHLDNTPPEIEVTMKRSDENYTNNTWTNQTVKVLVEATDKHSEVASLDIVIDGEESEKVEGDTHELILDESGTYELSITATDEVGNKTTEECTIK